MKEPPIHCAHERLVSLFDLRPHPQNPNKHPDEQIAMLAKIIAHQGWRSPITVSKRSGFIVAGHGRLLAAQQMGLEVAPVDDQDFATEADELAHLLADNRIAELAEADRTMLRELAEHLDTGGFDMDLTGFDYASLEELMTAAPPEAQQNGRSLTERFGVPPFSVLDARQGYWQERKRAWLALGIQSELGRGGGILMKPEPVTTENLNYYRNRQRPAAAPGGSARPACDYSQKQRGDGRGRPIK